MCQYRHGKLLLHLTLPFEKRPKGNQPGEYLCYYRLRNNLTTRQLAEQVGIIPATLLKYEQGLTPIPYDNTAVRLSEHLKIDALFLCDSFAVFIALPYTEVLKAIREELKLNQREFAELVGLKASYYYQMEKGNRRPSRKVYQQIIKDQKYTNTDYPHKNKIDITIVVDMLLTGFDSKYLNTLYVDKNLKYHGLIQAFSRTNRVLNDTKPYGNILDFRSQSDEVDKYDDVLIINASEYFEKGKRQNTLLPEHIDKIIETYQYRKEDDKKYSRRVSNVT